MHWVCSNPDCEQEHDNDEFRCDVCGTVRKSRLHLKTAAGKDWFTSGTFDIDRTVYKMLFSKEYQYLPKDITRNPYSVYKKWDGCWYMLFNSNSLVDIAINDTLCEPNVQYSLIPGMKIWLVSKANPNVKLAPVCVEFEFIN